MGHMSNQTQVLAAVMSFCRLVPIFDVLLRSHMPFHPAQPVAQADLSSVTPSRRPSGYGAYVQPNTGLSCCHVVLQAGPDIRRVTAESHAVPSGPAGGAS